MIHFRLLTVFVFGLFVLTACRSSPDTDPDGDPTALADAPSPVPTVEILNPEGRRIVYRVEVAATQAERAVGLMHRRELAPDAGMLFLFPSETYQRFWMKDTYIPLDILFISADLHVVGAVENARPHDTTSLFIDKPAHYGLEVNAGDVARHGIVPGSVVVFRDFR